MGMDGCEGCFYRQMRRVAEFCHLDDDTLATMLEQADRMVREAPRVGGRVKPTLMGDLLTQIEPLIGTNDPYKQVKAAYNALLLDREDECRANIAAADDPFQLALRYAAAGNLIDFGAKNEFTRDDVTELLDKVPSIEFAVDDSADLTERVRRAKSVMYLGDNCGEIVLDKVLIGEIRRENPDVDVTYGVRGGAVINDVTVDDAAQVGMADVARVVPSGAAVPATDLDRCSQEFLDAYYGADVVICKGMGNFESLCDDCRRDDVYFLLMTKCDLVAGVIGAPLLSLVCARNSDSLHAI